MKKNILMLAAALCLFTQAIAQAPAPKPQDGFQFTVDKENPISSIKNQSRSGTCWCFSSLGFMESELMRMGKPEMDLSEMFVVYYTYLEKVDKFVRTGGWINVGQGGAFSDYLLVLNKYGIVPEAEMKGLNYGTDVHTHGEMEAIIQGLSKAVKSNPNRKISTAWKDALAGVLDAYLGPIPAEFTYEGKQYTPQSFAASLDFKPEDYVSLTSYSHHPFYKQFAIEVADNWMWDLSWNLPIDELMETIDNAINNGYTVLWASDVSEQGFTRNGVAMYPTTNPEEMSGSDQARWLGMTPQQRNEAFRNITHPVPEIPEVTQEMRQVAYDCQQTTDDHGMQIYGIAHDQNGTKFYMVKNSWGETGPYKGVWYVSEKFVRYKTMDIMIHKDALPKNTRKQLGIK